MSKLAVRPVADSVLSEAALSRLPPLFREIVEHGRALAAYCSTPIVDFDQAVAMLDRQYFLARHADRYMRGDGAKERA